MSEIVLNNTYSMSKTKERKEKAINEMKAKLEDAKLKLIYAELEELNISFDRNYTTVKELVSDLQGKLNDIDYNNVKNIVDKIEVSLNNMVSELEKGSTTAFTKVMTSDLAKGIAKTLGITLAGRTALLLAPTVGTKALVAAGLAGYGLYRVIKNRKQVIEINETNELNNILQDLEVTKDENNNYLDTRFNESIQEEIRLFLKNSNVKFDDTGYRSLRETIYSLDNDKKKSLCTLLNSKIGKGIDIDKRVTKARRKLNVVASSTAGVSAGITLGMQAATAINSIDPALTAGLLNGTVLAAFVEKIAGTDWFTKLSGAFGLIGTEVLEHIPVIGGVATKLFAAENIATFAAAGATGGMIVSLGLYLASVLKKLFNYSKDKKENLEYLKLDSEKYGEIDKVELETIVKKAQESDSIGELAVVDIVTGYLKESNITLEGNLRSVEELRDSISKLPNKEKKIAHDILNKIEDNLSNDPEFLKGLKKAGKISIALFTSGLALMSVYDIIKGGEFLPELSKKLFPENNIYNPLTIAPVEQPYNIDNPKENEMLLDSRKVIMELNDKKYYTVMDNNAETAYGAAFMKYNPSFKGVLNGGAVVDAGVVQNATDKIHIFDFVIPENTVSQGLVPNVPAICDRLDQLSPKELYAFARYINNLSGGGDMLTTVKQVMGYETYLNKISEYIIGIEKTQKFHELIIDLSKKVMTGAIPFTAAFTAIRSFGNKKTNDDFKIDDNELESIMHK